MISQREAKRLKRRVQELEAMLRNQRNIALQQYHGEHLGDVKVADWAYQRVSTAAWLGHTVVAVPLKSDGTGDSFKLMALPHPQVPV